MSTLLGCNCSLVAGALSGGILLFCIRASSGKTFSDIGLPFYRNSHIRTAKRATETPGTAVLVYTMRRMIAFLSDYLRFQLHNFLGAKIDAETASFAIVDSNVYVGHDFLQRGMFRLFSHIAPPF
jgi:hypothetical protein